MNSKQIKYTTINGIDELNKYLVQRYEENNWNQCPFCFKSINSFYYLPQHISVWCTKLELKNISRDIIAEVIVKLRKDLTRKTISNPNANDKLFSQVKDFISYRTEKKNNNLIYQVQFRV